MSARERSKFVSVSAVQMNCKIGDKNANIRKATRLINRAATQDRADIVCLPELFSTGFNVGEEFYELSEPIPGHTTNVMCSVARRHRICIIVPIAERRRIPGVVYNTACLIGPHGSILGTYTKTHMPLHRTSPELYSEEKYYFKPGNEYPIFDTRLVRFGIMICYDRTFPEVPRILALKGAEVIFCPAASTGERAETWKAEHIAHAIENQLFIVAANRIGYEKPYRFYGCSLIVGPKGNIIKEAGSQETVVSARINLEDVVNERKRLPLFRDRRPETYAEISDIHL